jgi:hypothetical protein
MIVNERKFLSNETGWVLNGKIKCSKFSPFPVHHFKIATHKSSNHGSLLHCQSLFVMPEKKERE